MRVLSTFTEVEGVLSEGFCPGGEGGYCPFFFVRGGCVHIPEILLANVANRVAMRHVRDSPLSCYLRWFELRRRERRWHVPHAHFLLEETAYLPASNGHVRCGHPPHRGRHRGRSPAVARARGDSINSQSRRCSA